MKVLFVFKSENFLAPLGLCAVSAAARRAGHETALCEMKTQDVLGRVAGYRPDVIAYSSSTGEVKHYLAVNGSVKERFPEVFAIMGGPHPTFYPDVVQHGRLDAICRGEGDEAFPEVLAALAGGRPVAGIDNIMTPQSRSLCSMRNLVEDLDALPFPDVSLLYENTPMGSYPLKSVITSRGCPYNCSYCFNASWRRIYAGKGKAVRRNSVDYVIDEIDFIRTKWPLSFVKFYDDIFTYAADDWLEEFSEKYKRRIGLPFFILTRADLLNEDMVRLLKTAGCHTISMSIEAGNPRVRLEVLNRDMSDEQIIRAHLLCKRYGIHTFTNCIVGLPDTQISHDIESIDLSIRSKVTWIEFPIFHPYPQTELGQRTIDRGLYSGDYTRMHTSYMYQSPLTCFSRAQVNAQKNITVLGPVAIVFPWLRWIIVNVAIYLPHNVIYTLMYYVTKMYVFRTRIYVTRTSLVNSLRIFARSLKQELFRHENSAG